MPIYFTSPTFARAGVVAGFTLVAPLADTPASGPVSFTFYSANTTVNGQALTIATGFVHWIQIGGLTYSYVQTSVDTPTSIATELAALINSAPDLNAVASAYGAIVSLSPREDTDAPVTCSASEAYQAKGAPQTYTLVELTGNNLVPTLTKGVLFAQGVMYRPAMAPVVPPAPASRQSWLFWSSSIGFYWQPTSTPTLADDAFIGWVVTNATQIVAFSSRRIGNGQEAEIQAPLTALLIEGASGDTAVAPPLSFNVRWGELQSLPGMFILGNLAFPSDDNVDSVSAATFIVRYIDETIGPLGTLSASLASGATALSASAALPIPGASPVVFTFESSGNAGGVTIGPGYVHNIVIGTAVYRYTQLTADTAADVAAALAEAINSLPDPNAIATASGPNVSLAPLQDTGATLACTASDGNVAATLDEAMPTYVLVVGPAGTGPGPVTMSAESSRLNAAYTGEIIEVLASNGSQIVRGQKGSTALQFPAGSLIWPIKATTLFFALPGAAYNTAGWPSDLPAVPMGSNSLVAIDGWATNEMGDSPATTEEYASTALGGRFSAPTATGLAAQVSGFALCNTGSFVNGVEYTRDINKNLLARLSVVWTEFTDPNWAGESITTAASAADTISEGTVPLTMPATCQWIGPWRPVTSSAAYTRSITGESVNGDGVANAVGAPSVVATIDPSGLPSSVSTPLNPTFGPVTLAWQGASWAWKAQVTLAVDPNRARAEIQFQFYSDAGHSNTIQPWSGIGEYKNASGSFNWQSGWQPGTGAARYADLRLAIYTPEGNATYGAALNADVPAVSGLAPQPITSLTMTIEIEGTAAQGGGIFTASSSGALTRTGDSSHQVGDAHVGVQSNRMTFVVGVPNDPATRGIYVCHEVDTDGTYATPIIPEAGDGWFGNGVGWGYFIDGCPPQGTPFTCYSNWIAMGSKISYQRLTAATYNWDATPAYTIPAAALIMKVAFPAGWGLDAGQLAPASVGTGLGFATVGGVKQVVNTSPGYAADGTTLQAIGGIISLRSIATTLPGGTATFSSPMWFKDSGNNYLYLSGTYIALVSSSGAMVQATGASVILQDSTGSNTTKISNAGVVVQNSSGNTTAMVAAGLFIAQGWNSTYNVPTGNAISLTATNGVVMSTSWNTSGQATGPYVQVTSSLVKVSAGSSAWFLNLGSSSLSMGYGSTTYITFTTSGNVGMGLSDGTYSGFVATSWGGGFLHGIGLVGTSSSGVSVVSDNSVTPYASLTLLPSGNATLSANASVTIQYGGAAGPKITVDSQYVFLTYGASAPKLLSGSNGTFFSSNNNLIQVGINGSGWFWNGPTSSGSGVATLGASCPAAGMTPAGWMNWNVGGVLARVPYWI